MDTPGDDRSRHRLRAQKDTLQVGVDVGPIAATMLAQLIDVVAKTKSLGEALGYSSRNSYHSATGRIPDLRDKVMHPVRPLILDQAAVADLRETLVVVSELTSRADALSQS